MKILKNKSKANNSHDTEIKLKKTHCSLNFRLLEF